MSIAIPGDGPLNVKRTLGSLVPHPASIGKIMGAKTGITAPRIKLAGGGTANLSDLEQQMFQPIGTSGIVPNADINFITSPALQSGPGPGVAKANSTPQQQQNPLQDITQVAGAATGLANIGSGIGSLYNGSALQGGVNALYNDAAQTGILGSGAAANATYAAAPIAQAGSITATDLAAPVATDLGASISAAAPAAAVATDAAGAAGAAGAADAGFSIADLLPALFAAFADGGAIPNYDSGGNVSDLTNMLMRRESGETLHTSGMLNSAGPGRTDTINTNVPTGAYVIPADVVSGLGEGNSLAGSAVIDRMFSTSPHGVKAPQIKEGRGVKIPPAPSSELRAPVDEQGGPTVNSQFINSAGAYAKGGKAEKPDDGLAPVLLAGGEHVISPQQIINKFGSLKRGHRTLDHWVVMMRDKHIKDLKGLDHPVGSNVKK